MSLKAFFGMPSMHVLIMSGNSCVNEVCSIDESPLKLYASKKRHVMVSNNDLPIGRTIVMWYPPFIVFDAVQHGNAYSS